MFDIITFGSATQDIMVKPKQLTSLKYNKSAEDKGICFPFGSKIEISEMNFTSGGGGTNTAATFALQGLKTAYCGMVGKDVSGQEILKELKKLNINTKLVSTTDQKATNHSVVISGIDNDRTILTYRGAAELMSRKQIPWLRLRTKWMYFAPLTGLLCDNFEEMVDYAVSRKIQVAANPSIAQLSLPNFSQIAQRIDVLFLNQEEASFLTKIPVTRETEIFATLEKMGTKVVVMTKGADGIVVSDGQHTYFALPPQGRTVTDTTGAGDSFASGFLSEYIRSQNVEASIQLGMGNSVSCIAQVGAKNGLLKKDQEFSKVEIKKVALI